MPPPNRRCLAKRKTAQLRLSQANLHLTGSFPHRRCLAKEETTHPRLSQAMLYRTGSFTSHANRARLRASFFLRRGGGRLLTHASSQRQLRILRQSSKAASRFLSFSREGLHPSPPLFSQARKGAVASLTGHASSHRQHRSSRKHRGHQVRRRVAFFLSS